MEAHKAAGIAFLASSNYVQGEGIWESNSHAAFDWGSVAWDAQSYQVISHSDSTTASECMSESAGSTGNQDVAPAKVQSVARAAKRQRGRERRKMYKARAKEQAAADCGKVASCDLTALMENFETRAAIAATYLKLAVKRTFVDVCEDSFQEGETEARLPPPLFESTQQIEDARRAYRRFRLGHHQGVIGEIASKI